MRLSFGQEMQHIQKQVLAPRMIQSMEILQLPLLKLQEKIEQELIENPILETQQETPAEETEEETENPDAPAETEREMVVDEKSDNVDDFARLLELDREMPDYFDERPRVSLCGVAQRSRFALTSASLASRQASNSAPSQARCSPRA